MEQFDNGLKLHKIRKRKTSYDALKKLKKYASDDIRTLKARDLNALIVGFMDIMKYPVIYLLCLYGGEKIGFLLNQGLTEEQFLTDRGNLFFLLGNVLFLFIYMDS